MLLKIKLSKTTTNWNDVQNLKVKIVYRLIVSNRWEKLKPVLVGSLRSTGLDVLTGTLHNSYTVLNLSLHYDVIIAVGIGT